MNNILYIMEILVKKEKRMIIMRIFILLN